MKKSFSKLLVCIIVLLTLLSNTYVYADEVTESNWVKKAFTNPGSKQYTRNQQYDYNCNSHVDK